MVQNPDILLYTLRHFEKATDKRNKQIQESNQHVGLKTAVQQGQPAPGQRVRWVQDNRLFKAE